MKFELKEMAASMEAITLPALYQNNEFGYVVLFSSTRSGLVVKNTDSKVYVVGFSCETWISCYSKDRWTRLPAGTQIVLTQE